MTTDAASSRTPRVEAKLENEPEAQRFLSIALSEVECPTKACKELCFALEGLFVNVAHCAYAPGSGGVEASVTVADDARNAKVVLRDGGTPFDPFGRTNPETPCTIEETPVGGCSYESVK